MNGTKAISPWQFTAFRIVFGTYLSFHFAQLLPWAAELFGNGGVLADARLNPLHGLFPNPLVFIQWPQFPPVFIGILLVCALAFTAGFFQRTSALLLWFGWACLFNRNNLIANPGIPYVGLLLILCTLVPAGEPLSFGRGMPSRWSMPAIVYWVPWVLMAVGYTYSGVWKVFSPSWIDGTTLLHLIQNPLARPGFFRDLLLHRPLPVLKAFTWLALAGEIAFVPLCITRQTRLTAWLWMMGMHLGILLVIDFADLTFGMIMVHLFTFDPAWLPQRKMKPLVLFDGECVMCNRWVRFIAAEEESPDFNFAPLRGETARLIFLRHGIASGFNESVVLVEFRDEEECVFTRSTAVLRILRALGGIWRVVSWLQIIPTPIRDGIYNFVAANRLRWFGNKQFCSLSPLPATRLLS